MMSFAIYYKGNVHVFAEIFTILCQKLTIKIKIRKRRRSTPRKMIFRYRMPKNNATNDQTQQNETRVFAIVSIAPSTGNEIDDSTKQYNRGSW